MSTLPAVDYQPRLGWWGHAWRILAELAISTVAWWALAPWQWNHDRGWFWADLATGVVCFVAVQFRRRWPVPVVVLTTVASAFAATSAGPGALALASLATRRRWREIVPLAIASVVAAAIYSFLDPVDGDPVLLNVVAGGLALGVIVATGMYVGSRRELLWTLRERAITAESEQALRVSQARTAERARIAREMHDVLAHRISLVTMHAGALAYRTDLSAQEVREASQVIQENAHRALVDLRNVLGVLRDEEATEAPTAPQPTWSEVGPLVTEAREAGMHVDLVDEVPDDVRGEQLGRTVYRIVQEGLTNARKHAPDTSVTIALTSDDDVVEVEVRNPLRVGDRRTVTPPSGLGLVGLAERAALAGGRVRHEITARQEFRLTAALPWHRD